MPTHISTAFYDSLFDVKDSSTSMNEIEEATLNNVREILNSPESLSDNIPSLPSLSGKIFWK